MDIEELSNQLNGKGRAQAVWDCYRLGIDPLLYFTKSPDLEGYSLAPFMDSLRSPPQNHENGLSSVDDLETVYKRMQKRVPNGLGLNALGLVADLAKRTSHEAGVLDETREKCNDLRSVTVEDTIATLYHINVSADGTTKLLLNMQRDNLQVETVIIPWLERGRSTLCISSQVGCAQGCTFCATGKMGKLRNLSSDEILVQVYYANKICRLTGDDQKLPPVNNIVFMGMGEPADNIDAVVRTANILTDQDLFGLGQSKVTISTVAPSPEVFMKLASANAALAWSVHAVNDKLRKKLVPTTRYTMEELRMGFVNALNTRNSKSLRMTMLEIALIHDVNDQLSHADDLADFALNIMHDVKGSIKLVVNLIPFNDIGHATYRKPSIERVLAFQKRLVDRGVYTYIRKTRGDDESAACGQLATTMKKQRKDQNHGDLAP
eukprot:CAMPEP_0194400192 /NCGR_PEP_ID=MMETSP0174-20130528/127070_1 /TAXON_ID=216777 /ORGANISM="Proboscia alata, Strain PI-D3" /LENGTH=434 /DNA_ID=CAMNT_0039196667 /DNA_START=252 /DNA_END=1556 /DNA_ORIENTATION=+